MGSTETDDRLLAELSGLDALELALPPKPSFASRLWASLWPKCMAIGIAVLFWQIVVWSGWKPEYVLPGPAQVFPRLYHDFGDILKALGTTMQRAVIGYTIAVVLGSTIGAVVARSRVLRAGFGSLITGLQTMPSVAWFPLAILLFKLTNGAILFVVVLGATPSIANGLIGGIDNIPPVLLRAGRVLGAKGVMAFRHVILPAALPSFVGGLKQGWAFAWRSLLAGELITTIPGTQGLGQVLEFDRTLADATGVISVMIVILIIGIVVDELLFGTATRWIRRRYGLIDEAAT